MGRPKQLLPVNGTPAVRRCAEVILQAGLRDVVVVTGADSAAVEEAIGGLPVRIVRNDRPGSEMIDSVRLGLQAVADPVSSLLLCLADHPLILPATISRLVAEGASLPHLIVIPVHQGRRGHPTLFPRPIINEVHSGRTLRDVIGEHAGSLRLVAVDDPGVVLDMDTPEEYQHAARISSSRS
jgi:CTP:molybdopterin cytidylyltransferase MocA